MLDKNIKATRLALKVLRFDGTSRPFFCVMADGHPALHISRKAGNAKKFGVISAINKVYKKYDPPEPLGDKVPFVSGTVTNAAGTLVFVPVIKKNGMAAAGLTRALRKLRRTLKLPAFQVSSAVTVSDGSDDADANRAAADAAQKEADAIAALEGRLARMQRLPDAGLQKLQAAVEAFADGANPDLAAKMRAAVAAEHARRAASSLAPLQQAILAQVDDIPTMSDDQLYALSEQLSAYRRQGGSAFDAVEQQLVQEIGVREEEAYFAEVLRTGQAGALPLKSLVVLQDRIDAYYEQADMMDLSGLEQQIAARLGGALASIEEELSPVLVRSKQAREVVRSMEGRPLSPDSLQALDGVLAELASVQGGLQAQLAKVQALF